MPTGVLAENPSFYRRSKACFDNDVQEYTCARITWECLWKHSVRSPTCVLKLIVAKIRVVFQEFLECHSRIISSNCVLEVTLPEFCCSLSCLTMTKSG